MSEPERWHQIAAASQVIDAEPFAARLGETPIALYRLKGSIYAIDDICTHEFALLSQGFVEDCAIECPLHQARFDIVTGRCVGPPATIDLRAYAVKVEGDAVFVRTPPLARDELRRNTKP